MNKLNLTLNIETRPYPYFHDNVFRGYNVELELILNNYEDRGYYIADSAYCLLGEIEIAGPSEINCFHFRGRQFYPSYLPSKGSFIKYQHLTMSRCIDLHKASSGDYKIGINTRVFLYNDKFLEHSVDVVKLFGEANFTIPEFES